MHARTLFLTQHQCRCGSRHAPRSPHAVPDICGRGNRHRWPATHYRADCATGTAMRSTRGMAPSVATTQHTQPPAQPRRSTRRTQHNWRQPPRRQRPSHTRCSAYTRTPPVSQPRALNQLRSKHQRACVPAATSSRAAAARTLTSEAAATPAIVAPSLTHAVHMFVISNTCL